MQVVLAMKIIIHITRNTSSNALVVYALKIKCIEDATSARCGCAAHKCGHGRYNRPIIITKYCICIRIIFDLCKYKMLSKCLYSYSMPER